MPEVPAAWRGSPVVWAALTIAAVWSGPTAGEQALTPTGEARFRFRLADVDVQRQTEFRFPDSFTACKDTSVEVRTHCCAFLRARLGGSLHVELAAHVSCALWQTTLHRSARHRGSHARGVAFDRRC